MDHNDANVRCTCGALSIRSSRHSGWCDVAANKTVYSRIKRHVAQRPYSNGVYVCNSSDINREMSLFKRNLESLGCVPIIIQHATNVLMLPNATNIFFTSHFNLVLPDISLDFSVVEITDNKTSLAHASSWVVDRNNREGIALFADPRTKEVI